jgi:dTDP-4-dehydrorhamnose reductase
MKSKIALCGGSGLVGREMIKLLNSDNIQYIATYNNNVIENGVKIDFFNKDDILTTFKKYNITNCINCIVERQVEICEKKWEIIKKINVQISENIAKVCSLLNIHMIHISTDYVFDGKNAPYYPESNCNPLQNYGISKLLSELKVKAYCNNYCIIRVPVLYTDDIVHLEETAVTLISKKVMDRTKTHKEDNYSVRRPTYIPDFCKFIYEMFLSELKGVYHFGNNIDKTSKYEMAKEMSSIMNKPFNIEPINEIPDDGVERPIDTQLLDAKYNLSSFEFTPLKTVLEKIFIKYYHPKILPTNINDFMFLIDLDGTLIDSDYIHYTAYDNIFNSEYDKLLTYESYIEKINKNTLNEHLMDNTGDHFKVLKDRKQEEMKFICSQLENLNLMPGAEEFINFLVKNNCNYCVVTNTNKENVKLFQDTLPILKKLDRWITREDYNNPKPNSECYKLAIAKYRKNEKYIIGIENTLCGVNALKEITPLIYCMTDKNNRKYIEKEDIFLINNFSQITNINIVYI